MLIPIWVKTNFLQIQATGIFFQFVEFRDDRFKMSSCKESAKLLDKTHGVKNCWSVKWETETVKLSWGTEKARDRVEVEVQLKDSITKIDQPGIAKCNLCHTSLNYSNNGKKTLIQHVQTPNHVAKVKDMHQSHHLSTFSEKVSLNLVFFWITFLLLIQLPSFKGICNGHCLHWFYL